MSSKAPPIFNMAVFKYLQESGFSNSAHAFENEARISRSTIDRNRVPPGALVKLVKKGSRCYKPEATVSHNDADIVGGSSSLQPRDVITKDAYETQKIRKKKQDNVQETKHGQKQKGNDVSELDKDHARKRKKEQETERERERDQAQEREKEHDRERLKEKQQVEIERELGKERKREKDKRETPHADLTDARHDGDKMKIEPEEEIPKPEPMDVEAVDISPNSTAMICIIPDSDVMVLRHTSEVIACAWSPSAPRLASGAGDSTARIWTINEGLCSSNMQGVLPNAVELNHINGIAPIRNVTTLDWNGEGTMLATGCCTGETRIWTKDGELVKTLDKHKGHIVSLKWNKKGDYLLSGSVDGTAIVWDTNTGKWKQQFEFHSAPLLDVDWRNNVTFATCSADTKIFVGKVGEDRPRKTFSGHQGAVNVVKWDPTGQLLASCSDDGTAKIWNMKQDTCLHDLEGHTGEVYTISWCPAGPGTNISNQQLLLASASSDTTIKLWDVESGSLIYSVNGHRDPVNSVAFSPNGDYLASGSWDERLLVWSVKEARIVKIYTGNWGIFQVCWNKEGDRIAACLENGEVRVFNFRM